jgi:HD-GYP domain-containing protein (c-di-GMP phosphodiesterase class II)
MNFHSDTYARETTASIMKKIEELNHLNDIDTILDKILFEARQLSHADAGSIFIMEDDKLRFGYVHNDTLFKEHEVSEAIYGDYTIPVNDHSIVGYVALTGEPLTIDNAYHIPSGHPYMFNPEYDHKSGYTTTSMLTIPLMTFHGKRVGVMQLLNAKNQGTHIVPFSKESQALVPLFANNAAVAVDRGIMNREMILRMVRMAELRDPTETGTHVQRVGAYAAEIFQQWAIKRGMDIQEMKRKKDLIRLAAMLHDVGKVGIPDKILNKPEKLSAQEYDIMKWHTVYGGRLFNNQTSQLDAMSLDIALNHHEKWNGRGYPGKIDNIMSDEMKPGVPKKTDEIPLSARIVALADVYDALATKRPYKESWSDDQIFETIRNESGNHFDPELVNAFFEIISVIKAIQTKYRD